MQRSDFGLFFPEPLQKRDWDNLDASTVQSVMLHYQYADPKTLGALRERGVKAYLRIWEADLYHDDFAAYLRDYLKARTDLVYAVILGNEPDGEFDLTRHSPDWGNGAAFIHNHYAARALDVVKERSLLAVSAPLKMRNIDGRFGPPPDNGPQPGLGVWVCNTWAYASRCDLSGVNVYGYDPTDYDFDERFKRHLSMMMSVRPSPVVITECNVYNGTSEQSHMAACLRRATYCLGIEDVRAFFPFVSNGTPEGWPAQYLMTSPDTYALVRAWMGGKL